MRRKKLLEHETSAQFLSASFNIVCEEGAVSLPVPFLDFQHSLNSGIHSQIGANIARCMQAGGLSWPIDDSACSQSQTYQAPNPGEGVILVAYQRLPLASCLNAARL